MIPFRPSSPLLRRKRFMRDYRFTSVVLLLVASTGIFITGCGGGSSNGGGITSSSTALTASATSVAAGASVTLTATVTPTASTGTVNFFDGTTSLGSGALSGGAATLATSALTVGAHSITAVYTGNTSYSTSTSAALTITVTAAPPASTTTALSASATSAAAGSPITFTATVSPSAATGSVTFFDGATSIGTGTLNGGIATLATSSLAVGTHMITASYGGSSSYAVSTSAAVAITINAVATTTALSPSATSVVAGSPVTFTATVSPGAATGSVTFFDGTASIGTGTLNGGIATLATSSLAAGTHSITAAYSASGFYAASTSSAITITITGSTASTATLAASASSAATGVAVTFTATVRPATGTGTPTGTVTFTDGATTIGTGTLNAGIAALSSSSLAVGVHNITAVYAGDNTYATSTAAAVTVAITSPDGAAVALTSNLQVAAYTFTLQLPGTVTVNFGTTTGYGLMTNAQHFAAGTPATIYVAGMLGSTTYHVQSSIVYDNGATQTDPDLTVGTGPVPSYLIPALTVTQTPGLTPQPGIELVNTLNGNKNSTVFATDLNGNVIWTYLFPDRQIGTSIVYPAKLLPNGHFMLLIAPNSTNVLPPSTVDPTTALDVLREIDLAGNTIRQIAMTDLNASIAAAGFKDASGLPLVLQLFSHDFTVLPNGHTLVIANTFKSVTLTGATTPTNVLGDVVIDLDQNFKPVWFWDEFDHLDVNRQPMGFPDWTHSNALAYSADDGNFLISIRHQNWIIKVDYNNGAGAGDIIWKLGYQGDFALQGATDPVDWFYAQHDVNFASANTTGTFSIGIMDNGDDRIFSPATSTPYTQICGTTGEPACYTTADVMQVNESTKTASYDFHQIVPTNLYNSFAGDTRLQPNGNVEYNLAGVGVNAYVFEVTPTATPQTVWEMMIPNNTYRVFRIPSLYPGVQP